ncbi:MAG: T9SS type A sorting domain-containing protein [Bacteroidales bacterium]|nr:T9SS type A sorting domain-containing protein [Bacteroidales bacterium]
MKKLIAAIIVIFLTLGTIYTQNQLPAFPGAEGHGKYTNGGRGGRIIEVTNLAAGGPGSFKAAVESFGARIVVFRVSGTIKLVGNLVIKNDSITIAGQTAPGDGICIRDYPVIVDADNVIIRFLRFRMGDEAMQENDALGGRYHKNIIVDHCSMSWSTDECVSFYINENFTLQWSIISESLRISVHDKGAHGYGGIWGGKNASFHHNLLASHDSRNPRLGEAKGDAYALTDLVDLRNNVIYNWGGNSCYGGEAMNANIVNCYYKPGPATSKTERIISIDKLLETGYDISNMWGKFYIEGNVLSASERATNDNWTYGVYNQFNSKYGLVPQAEKDAMRLSEPLNPGEVTTHTADLAYNKVLYHAGASLYRDPVDTRIIHDVSTGTATFMDGGNGSVNGIIDTQSAVGGWPVLNSTAAPADTDGDGMPDEWEIANALNENDPNDGQLKTVDGLYPNIEVYLNSLVSDIIEAQNTNIPSGFRPLQVQDESPLKIFYNKATEELMIFHTKKIQTVQLYSMMGSLVLELIADEKEVGFQIPDLKNGTFIVRILDDGNKFYAQKFIK